MILTDREHNILLNIGAAVALVGLVILALLFLVFTLLCYGTCIGILSLIMWCSLNALTNRAYEAYAFYVCIMLINVAWSLAFTIGKWCGERNRAKVVGVCS